MGYRALDDSGQSSVDFIFGFGVFLLTFIFAISFVSGLFTPFQPGAIDLSSVAYRTGALLSEDPGWYIGANGTPSGTALWETYDQSLLNTTGSGLRIGLANSKSTPNMLSIDKIDAFQTLATSNYPLARDRLGLNGSTVYNFNISIVVNTTIPANGANVSNITVLNIDSPTTPNNNVELLDRKVMVDLGQQLFINSNLHHNDSMQFINVSNLTADYRKSIIIRIYNTSTTGTAKLYEVGWGPADGIAGPQTWAYITDYMIYKNRVPVNNFPMTPLTINSTDIVEVVIYDSAFKDPITGNLYDNRKYIYLKADSSIFPGGDIKYFDDPSYPLIDVYYPATLRLEIWSYAFS